MNHDLQRAIAKRRADIRGEGGNAGGNFIKGLQFSRLAAQPLVIGHTKRDGAEWDGQENRHQAGY